VTIQENILRQVRNRVEQINQALADRLPPGDQEPRAIHEAMRAAVLDGGKRVRPLLMTAVFDLEGHPPEAVLDAACGLEMLHAASLIIDDLPSMDNARERRGQPAAHVRFGEATAILAAMGLVAEAFRLVSINDDQLGMPEAGLAAVRELARAMGTAGIVTGQHLDLATRPDGITTTQLEEVCIHKAAALFLAAVRIPAVLLSLPDDKTKALERYALSLGLAFQVTDDLLDAANREEDAGKATYATHLGMDGARIRALELVEEAADALSIYGDAAGPLQLMARQIGARIT
jgi:geranylgeranyl pyrophosphate synthase